MIQSRRWGSKIYLLTLSGVIFTLGYGLLNHKGLGLQQEIHAREVVAGEVRRFTINVVNNNWLAPVVVDNMASSCGCLEVGIDKTEIAAGQTAMLTVSLAAPVDRVGTKQEAILLHWRSKHAWWLSPGVFRLEFKMDIKPAYVPEYKSYALGDIGSDKEIEQRVPIFDGRPEKTKPAGFQVSPGGSSAIEVTALEADGVADAALMTKFRCAGLPEGAFRESKHVLLLDKEQKTVGQVNVVFSGYINRAGLTGTKSLYLGEVTDSRLPVDIVLTATGEEKLTLEAMEISNGQIESGSISSKQVDRQLLVSAVADFKLRSGSIDETVTLKLQMGGRPVLYRVPLLARFPRLK